MRIEENIQIDWTHNVRKLKTVCVLTIDGQEFHAQSRCGHGDQYSKITGRKISLKRAFEKTGLDKAARTNIWQAIIGRGVKLYNSK